MKILLTGATGFLGKTLVEELLKAEHELFIHSRQSESKCRELFPDSPLIKFVQGDLTSLDIIANEADRNKVIDEVEVVFHAAALYDLKASYADCFMQNVVSTQNIIHFMRLMKKLKAFYHVSTIAVGDPDQFFLEEDQLPKRSRFNDFYSETKYLAELIVREQTSDRYVTRILRPGIIVGDTRGRQMPKTDGPYYFIEAAKKYAGLLKRLPMLAFSFNPRTKIPLIPVDHCARLMALLVTRDTFATKTKTYHLISPDAPSVNEFLQDLNRGLGLNTTYIPLARTPFNKFILPKLGIPKEVESFMFSKLSYDKTSTLEDLPELDECNYSQFKDILMK